MRPAAVRRHKIEIQKNIKKFKTKKYIYKYIKYIKIKNI